MEPKPVEIPPDTLAWLAHVGGRMYGNAVHMRTESAMSAFGVGCVAQAFRDDIERTFTEVIRPALSADAAIAAQQENIEYGNKGR